MAAEIHVLRRRIKSTQSIKKITRAVELIAVTRIQKVRAQLENSVPYAQAMTRVLATLVGNTTLDHPLLIERAVTRRAGILVVTSDRGQCGGYNHKVFTAAEELHSMLRAQGKTPVLYIIGRKGVVYYQFHHRPITMSWTGFSEKPRYAEAAEIARTLGAAFMTGHGRPVDESSARAVNDEGIDELHLVYTTFQNMMRQAARAQRIAPIQLEYAEDGAPREAPEDSPADRSTAPPGSPQFSEFEPDADPLLQALLPTYLSARLYAALLESAASESAHRQQSMKAATDNAAEMIRTLTLEVNQARQSQITEEIIEVISGAEALRGTGRNN
jgi:F-type H+-transporting ATPase subunit gamma